MSNNTEEKIDHPQHYTHQDGLECIEEMELVFGPEAVMTFCLLNIWKYRYRASDKNGAEDMGKSDWYMAKYKELKEKNKRPTPTFWRPLKPNDTPYGDQQKYYNKI